MSVISQFYILKQDKKLLEVIFFNYFKKEISYTLVSLQIV